MNTESTVYTKELQLELSFEQLLEKYPDARTVYTLPEYMHKVDEYRAAGMDTDIMLLYPDICRPIAFTENINCTENKIESITLAYSEIFAKMWLELVNSRRKITSDKSKSGDKTIRRKSPYNFGRSKY